MWSAARLVVVFLALACCAVWAAPAGARRSSRSAGVAPASHVVLGSSFRPLRDDRLGGDLASGDYLASSTTVGTGWIVINDRLGTTTALDPQCHVVGLGPPWVLMSCPQSSNPSGAHDVELYSLAD